MPHSVDDDIAQSAISVPTPILLARFAAAIAGSVLDENEIIKAAVNSCKDLLKAKQCSIWLVDDTGEYLVLRGASGYEHLSAADIGTLSYRLTEAGGSPPGITAWIFMHKQRVSADSYSDLRQQPGYRGLHDPQLHGVDKVTDDEHPCQQFYGGPIFLGDEMFGVLKVENKQAARGAGRDRFTEDEKAALDTVASMLALALKPVWAAKREQIPLLLRKFAAALAQEVPDEQAILEAAVESCRDLLQAKQCSIWLVDGTVERVVLRAALGYEHLSTSDLGRLSYTLEGKTGPPGITAWIFMNKQRVSADSYSELRQQPGYGGLHDPQLHGVDKVSDEEHPCQQFYGGPIYLGEEVVGVLKVENKKVADNLGKYRFTESEKAALDTVAAMLALALKHARAGEAAKQRLAAYHRFTIHSIRNELAPATGAKEILIQLCNSRPELTGDIEGPMRFLRRGIEGVDFYLDNLLTFLTAEIKEDQLKQLDICRIIQDEVWLLQEIASDELRATYHPEPLDGVSILGAEPFIAAAVKELLRNARKAVHRRRSGQKRKLSELYIGSITVNVSKVNRAGSEDVPQICISITDDGDATTDPAARSALERAWGPTYSQRGDTSTQTGVKFVQWMADQHGGNVSLNGCQTVTTVDLYFPVEEPPVRADESTSCQEPQNIPAIAGGGGA